VWWLLLIHEPKHIAVKLYTSIKVNTSMVKKREAHYIWVCTVSGNGTISRCPVRIVKLSVVVSATRVTGLCNVDTTVTAGLAYWLGCRSLGSSHSRLIYYRARSLAILFCYRVWARLFVTSCAVLRSLILTAHRQKGRCVYLTYVARAINPTSKICQVWLSYLWIFKVNVMAKHKNQPTPCCRIHFDKLIIARLH